MATTQTTTTIAICGARRLRPGAPARIRTTLGVLAAAHPAAVWRLGGAVGADQIAADTLIEHGEHVELILPFPLSVQGRLWSPEARERLARQIARARAVTVISDTYNVGAYHRRNARLVDGAHLVLAIASGAPTPGTLSTVREAQRRGVPVRWLRL